MTPREVIRELLLHDLAFAFHEMDGAPDTIFRITAKASGIIAGMKFIPMVLDVIQAEFFLQSVSRQCYPVHLRAFAPDGTRVAKSDIVAEFLGNAEVLLKAERTILNILTSCSGIATVVANDVARIAHTRVKLLDTRKDAAILREMHKDAVRVGGGTNHRTGMYDGIIIKDNDIAVYGGVVPAIDMRKKTAHLMEMIEIEVGSIDTLMRVFGDGRADIIMLDNMSPTELRRAVHMIRFESKPYVIEASGIGGYDLVEIAETGVDYISQSSLVTRGLGNPLDMSMKAIVK